VAATLPTSLRKVLREIQKDAAVRVAFGDDVNGAFKMVYLGSCETARGWMKTCESPVDLDKLVSTLLHNVLLSGTLARKVTLISSFSALGVVDRENTSEVILKHPMSSIVYHALKEVKRGRESIAFIVLIAKSPYLDHDIFHAFQGKSNWSRDKVPFVDATLTEARRAAYETGDDEGTDSEMTGNGERVDIPRDAKVFRAKYIGSSILGAAADYFFKQAVITTLLDDKREMRKQTKEKTLQHVVDFARDTVLVAHQEALRIVGAGNRELLNNAIVTRWVEKCTVLDLDEIYNDEASVKRLQGTHRRSRSKSPGRRRWTGRAHSKELHQRLVALPSLSDEQRQILHDRVVAGDVSVDEAMAEAERLQADFRDSVVLITWRDETLDQLKVEMLVIKNSRSKADVIAAEVNEIVTAAKRRADDPFQPTSKKSMPRSELLGAAEVSRDDIIAVQMIGSGQFGEVYLANQHVDAAHSETKADQDVQRAVKTLRKGAGKTQRREFCGEAELQLQLSHKNIVKVTGVCMQQKPYLCILEFEPYGDLNKVLSTCDDKGIVVNTVEQAWILKQISDAMMYIHSKKFVHMDLATRNALMGPKSRVKVADFGLSQPYDDGRDGYKLKGQLKLPMLWTPPECFPPIVTHGEPRAAVGDEIPFYSERTDMWMFGVVIWEVVSYSEKPYGFGSGLMDTLKRICHEKLRLQYPPGAHAAFGKLMHWAFSDSPDERPKFSECCKLLDEELAAAGGRQAVRDLGVLLHEGLAEKLSRSSFVVRSSMQARRSGISTHDLASTTQSLLLAVKEEKEQSKLTMPEAGKAGGGGGNGGRSHKFRPHRPLTECRRNVRWRSGRANEGEWLVEKSKNTTARCCSIAYASLNEEYDC